jgi:hypothetical protein
MAEAPFPADNGGQVSGQVAAERVPVSVAAVLFGRSLRTLRRWIVAGRVRAVADPVTGERLVEIESSARGRPGAANGWPSVSGQVAAPVTAREGADIRGQLSVAVADRDRWRDRALSAEAKGEVLSLLEANAQRYADRLEALLREKDRSVASLARAVGGAEEREKILGERLRLLSDGRRGFLRRLFERRSPAR